MAGNSLTENPMEAIIRNQMMSTASRYATFAWKAEEKHVRHDEEDGVDTPDRHTYIEEKKRKISQDRWSEWHGWAYGWNCGVPYFWGGDAALVRGLDFLNGTNELTFEEVLEQGTGSPPVYDAGDISAVDKSTIRWKSASGVDCSGFVAQVWRLGHYFNPNLLKELSRPIKFEDLKPGDLLYMKPVGTSGHVMLFKEFLTAERAAPGKTRIMVYESAGYCARVGLTEYKLYKPPEEEPEPPQKNLPPEEEPEFNNPIDITEDWKGINISTQEVILKRIATYYGKDDHEPPIYDEEHFERVDLTPLEKEEKVTERIKDQYFGPYEIAFYPRTYITPVDVVLVIDQSGSMKEGRLESAKAAAKMFVDLMSPVSMPRADSETRPIAFPGGKIGVVAFNQIATLAFPLQTIDLARTVGAAAHNAIDALVAEGGTSIGGALQLAFGQLNTKGVDAQGRADPLRIMVLLSDGQENAEPFVTDEMKDNVPAAHETILDRIRHARIKVLTVGFGANSSDPELALLKDIAALTGGIYRYAPPGFRLQRIFLEFVGSVYGEDVVGTIPGSVPSRAVAEEKIPVDSTIGSMTFSLFWPGSDLDLTLVQPDGRIIDPSVAKANPNISFTSGGTYKFYKVYNPQAGEWTIRIYGKSTPADGEAYFIAVSAMSSMNASIKFDKAEYFAGDPVKIEARIEDTFIDFAEPNYVLGAAIKVTVEDPYLNQHSFELYDDGLHGDGEANDGVYANIFPSTSLMGNYNFTVQVSGANNRDGRPFTREYAFSHVLKDPTLRFPNTPVLDEFNRKNGRLGRSWSGAKRGYRIVDQQVHVRQGGPIYWKPGILAADQQAFIPFAHVDPAGLKQGLLLKVQDKANNPQSWRKGAISVFYSAREGKVGIKSSIPRQKWKTLVKFDATLQDGDQLGGRAEADGMVRAYVNGVEIGSVNAGSFFAGKGGRIGMWFTDAEDAVLDDFGGGGAITASVIQGTDDAGLDPTDCNYRTDNGNIYFGYCMDGSPITSGFRFQNILLPAHATIVEAHLEFTVDGPYANEMALQFLGERSANAATFSDTDRPSDRPMTAALVPWAIPAVNAWTFNRRRRTPSVTPIVQELVNLPDWASGNAIAIIVQPDPGVPGVAGRRVYAWEREEAAAARLVVIYTIGSLADGDDHDDDNHEDDNDDDDNDR